MRIEVTSLSGFLREKRIAAGLSQLEVAQKLGYSSPQFVSNWERGLVSPPLETLATLIRLYKLNSHDLIRRLLSETESYLNATLLGTSDPSLAPSRPARSSAAPRKRRTSPNPSPTGKR
jgi:transcriptional regulator with XRE-family HTH domain